MTDDYDNPIDKFTSKLFAGLASVPLIPAVYLYQRFAGYDGDPSNLRNLNTPDTRVFIPFLLASVFATELVARAIIHFTANALNRDGTRVANIVGSTIRVSGAVGAGGFDVLLNADDETLEKVGLVDTTDEETAVLAR